MKMTSRTTVPTPEGLQLLADHLNIDLNILQQASENKREAARIARLQAQIEAEREAEARKLERSRKALTDAWQAGHIIVRVDGKILSKPGDICKTGEPDLTKVINLTIGARGKLLQQFKGLDLNGGEVQKGATIRRTVKCTCGKDHFVEVFITGYSTR